MKKKFHVASRIQDYLLLTFNQKILPVRTTWWSASNKKVNIYTVHTLTVSLDFAILGYAFIQLFLVVLLIPACLLIPECNLLFKKEISSFSRIQGYLLLTARATWWSASNKTLTYTVHTLAVCLALAMLEYAFIQLIFCGLTKMFALRGTW